MRVKFCLIFILVACATRLNFGQQLDYEIFDDPAHFPEGSERFPFVCLVVIADQFCTGTILASKAVLTSKRCLFNSRDYKNYKNYKNMVHAGVYEKRNPHKFTQSVEVRSLLPYNWEADLRKFDIMLVLVKEPFKWDRRTQPFVLSDTVEFPTEKSENCLLLGLDTSKNHRLTFGVATVVHPLKCMDCEDDDDVHSEISTACSFISSHEKDPNKLLPGSLLITQGVQIGVLSAVNSNHVTYSYVASFRRWILKHVPQVAFSSMVNDYDYGSEKSKSPLYKYPQHPLATFLAAQLLLQSFLRVLF